MPSQRRLTARKQPTQARSRQTVEAILEAGAQVFEEQGYARATTDRIAARAGVSIGSLYQYFPNKDAIVMALADRHADSGIARVRELLRGVQASSSADRLELAAGLRRFVDALVELHRAQPRLHQMLFVEAPIPSSQHSRLAAFEDELAAQIAALLSSYPEVRIREPKLAAWMLIHASQGLVHDSVVHPPPGRSGKTRFVDHLVRMLHAYLVAQGPS